MNDNPYIDILDRINADDINYRNFFFDMAKQYPEETRNILLNVNGVKRTILDTYQKFGKIEAIKAHRSLTESSLKEAKEYVETEIIPIAGHKDDI